MKFNEKVDVSQYDDHSPPCRINPDGEVEINEFELSLIDDLFCQTIEQVEQQNEQFKKEGWSGTGVVGTYLLHLKTALARFRAMPSARW